jgi:hypothetical protein
MTDEIKKPAGRPRKFAGKRPTWTIRLQEDVGQRVKDSAGLQGRSISETCEGLITLGLNAEIELIRQRTRADASMALLEAQRDRMRELSDQNDRLQAAVKSIEYVQNLLVGKDTGSIGDLIERAVERAFEKRQIR